MGPTSGESSCTHPHQSTSSSHTHSPVPRVDGRCAICKPNVQDAGFTLMWAV
jgi:hypothetical protein